MLKNKYLKYKKKYLELKKQLGGMKNLTPDLKTHILHVFTSSEFVAFALLIFVIPQISKWKYCLF